MNDKDRVKELLHELLGLKNNKTTDREIDFYANKIDRVYHPICNCSKCTGMPSIEDYYKD